MNFSNAILLLGLLGISIPIIIHLLNRRRHRTIEWGAMDFLRRATQESKGKKKLKHLIILTARALAIAGIVFAFSDPFFNSLGSSNSNPQTVFFILDRSPSMELVTNEGSAGGGKTKRQLAIDTVKKTMADMPDTKLFLIDSASTKNEEIGSPSRLDKLSNTRATDVSANIPKLIISAINIASNSDTEYGSSELWVASDLQNSNWNLESSDWLTINELLKEKPQISLRFIALNASTNNYSIQAKQTLREGEFITIETEVKRIKSTTPEDIQITYSVNNHTQTDTVEITADKRTVKKRIKLQKKQKNGFGYVSIEDDANTRDNTSFFVFGEDYKLNTTIVSSDVNISSTLNNSAKPNGFNHLNSSTISPQETLNFNTTDLLLWQAPLPEGKVAEIVHNFLESGGIALFFPPDTQSPNTFLELKWGKVENSAPDDFFNIESWNQTDGILQDGYGGEVLPLKNLQIIKRQTIQGEAIPLATFSDKQAFVMRKFIGKGKALFISTLPSLNWSYLDESALNLIIIHRLINEIAINKSSNTSTFAGSEVLKRQSDEDRERLDDIPTNTLNNSMYEAGVYRLGQRILAANRDPIEDLVEIAEISTLEMALPDNQYTLLENRGEQTSSSVIKKLWRWFLYSALIFFIIETILTLPNKVKIVS